MKPPKADVDCLKPIGNLNIWTAGCGFSESWREDQAWRGAMGQFGAEHVWHMAWCSHFPHEEWPFKCWICFSAFREKNVRIHVRVHVHGCHGYYGCLLRSAAWRCWLRYNATVSSWDSGWSNPQDPGSWVASDSQQTLPVDEQWLTESSQKSETLIVFISDKKVQLKSWFMYINVD